MDHLCILGSDAPDAQDGVARLRAQYGHVPAEQADVIVALGGDGFMLATLHAHMTLRRPVYGMNRGSVGFLMNDYDEANLRQRLQAARTARINPLRMRAHDIDGAEHEALAINEVALFRQRHQAAKIRISVDGDLRMNELICDGILCATPAGSTAYNLSAHGPILPIGANLLALTPVSAYRPRRWRGALLRHTAKVKIDNLDPERRPVAAAAEHKDDAPGGKGSQGSQHVFERFGFVGIIDIGGRAPNGTTNQL